MKKNPQNKAVFIVSIEQMYLQGQNCQIYLMGHLPPSRYNNMPTHMQAEMLSSMLVWCCCVRWSHLAVGFIHSFLKRCTFPPSLLEIKLAPCTFSCRWCGAIYGTSSVPFSYVSFTWIPTEITLIKASPHAASQAKYSKAEMFSLAPLFIS